MRSTWPAKLRWWAATLAAAIIMTYAGVATWTDVTTVAVGPAGPLWFAIISLCCGVLLGLVCERSIASVAIAAGIAVFAFGMSWSVIASQLLGRMFSSFLELGMSDAISLYILPRAGLVAAWTIIPSMLGAGAVSALMPERFQP